MKRSELFFAFILIPLDVLAIILGFAISYYFRAGLDSFNNISIYEYLRYAVYLMPIWIGLFALNGLYAIRATSGFFAELYRILIASTTAMLFLIVIIFLTKSFFFSRLIFAFTAILSILLIIIFRLTLRLIQKQLLKRGIGRRRVAIIGESALALQLSEYIIHNPNSSYYLAGVIENDITRSELGQKVLGTLDNLPLIIKKYSIDELILADPTLSKKTMASIIGTSHEHNITFKYIPDLYGIMTANFRQGLIGTLPVMELKPTPLDGWGRIIKRILDIFFALVLLIILSPLFLIIAILVKLTSRGPVFYSHPRTSRDEKSFNFFKFRSMYFEKCDFKGNTWTTAEDDHTRITPFGRIIRKCNLDELPQLWNILIGDMSFVGPRPEQPKLVEKFEKEIPEYFQRHKVRSGLTGWAQVNGLKGDTSVQDRIKYDLYYIENWSIWLDLKIILKTFILVLNEAFRGKSEYRHRS